MNFASTSCSDFTEKLSSRDPVPGGGGACALVGAVGTALGNMVGALTVGKKKYADVEDTMTEMMERGELLRTQLLDLMQRDAEVFAPLARAYALPKETAEERLYKQQVMEEALRGACGVPLQIMETCVEAVALLRVFAEKGSALAVSDAGVGALCCKAALQGASLNVLINTKAMQDRIEAESLNKRAEDLLSSGVRAADEIYQTVLEKLQ